MREMLVPANFMAGTFQIVRIKPLVAVTQLPQNANTKQWLDKIKMEARKENRIILFLSQSVLSCPSSSTGYVESPYSIAFFCDFSPHFPITVHRWAECGQLYQCDQTMKRFQNCLKAVAFHCIPLHFVAFL